MTRKYYAGFMLLRCRYRCYHKPRQEALLAKAFGCARVVWNDALALNRQLYQDKGISFDSGALMKRCITEAKRTKERSWLADASHSVLQQSVRDLSQAFRNWWQGQGRVLLRTSRNAVTVKASAPVVRSFTRQRPESGSRGSVYFG